MTSECWKEAWRQIIILDLLMVVHNMGAFYIWLFKHMLFKTFVESIYHIYMEKKLFYICNLSIIVEPAFRGHYTKWRRSDLHVN